MTAIVITKNSQGKLTASQARELFDYNPSTGVLVRKKRASNIPAGAQVGHANTHGYLQVKVGGKEYLVHRVVWLMVYGVWPSEQLDHKNRVRDDNRIANLREASQSENMQNRNRNANNTSGFKGVGAAKGGGRWRARIKANGRVINLGVFETAADAAAAYARAAAVVHTRNPAATGEAA